MAAAVLWVLLCATFAAAQMCPGIYEASQPNVTITVPGYGPYSGVTFEVLKLGIEAINTTTCYVYYDLFAVTPYNNGTLPRITVGPMDCDFGLPQLISFATINKAFCSQAPGQYVCCDGICKNMVALPTGVFQYTYYAAYNLLESITIGQNEDGDYWSGLSDTITLLNVNWNGGEVSAAATTAIASTTGFSSVTSSISTTGAATTTTALASTTNTVSTAASASDGAAAATQVAAAAVQSTTVAASTTSVNTGTYLTSTTAATTASTTTTAAATSAALETALASVTSTSATSGSANNAGTNPIRRNQKPLGGGKAK